MWRFILLSFVFMGWAFYEMSGGADYRPSGNSIQMRAQLDNQRPKPRPLRVNVIELAQDGAPRPETRVSRTVTSLHDLGLTRGKRVEVTLASADTQARPEPSPAIATPVNDNVGLPTVTVATQAPPESAEPETAALAPAVEIRRVAGRSVNLRTGPGTAYGRISSLARGTRVMVLRDPGNGWIKLRVAETGRIGWMADRLLTMASD